MGRVFRRLFPDSKHVSQLGSKLQVFKIAPDPIGNKLTWDKTSSPMTKVPY